MKAKFLALAALVLGMVSCQTDVVEGLHVDANGEAELTLQVGLPEATRASGNDSALGAIDNGLDLENTYDVRFILAVYDAGGNLAKRVEKFEDNATSTGFTIRLVPGRDYTFVVWADFVNEGTETALHYDASDLTDIKLTKNMGDNQPMDESRDAYTVKQLIKNFSAKDSNLNLILTRPFAKLRVVTNDMKELYSDLVSATIQYNVPLYTTFNALTAEPGDPEANVVKKVDYSTMFYANEVNPRENGTQTLFADYFFGAEDDRVMFTMDVKDGITSIPTVAFNTNIPVQRNHLTTVMGPILTDPSNITVEINDNFDGYYNAPVVDTTEALAEAVANAKSGDIIFIDGEVTMPYFTDKELNFVGVSTRAGGVSSKAIVKQSPATHIDAFYAGATLNFENLTLVGESYQNNTQGYQKAAKETYKNCHFVNYIMFAGETTTVTDCTFVNKGQYFWTGTAKNITFTNCKFNGVERAVKVCTVGNTGVERTVTLNNCEFTATTQVKSAIEIDGSKGSSYVVNINGCSATGFKVSDYTGESLFNIEGDDYVTVKIDGNEWISKGVVEDENGNYVVNSLTTLETALEAAGAAGAGNTTIVFAENAELNMTGVAWTPIKVDGYNGADIVTIEGNGAVITGLTAPLFAGGFAGGSGIVIKDLTIKDSAIVSANTIGSGAFIESVDSMAKIELTNCHLLNSTVTGGAGSRTGGLIGWTAGYNNVNDGPVKTYVTIDGCSVVGCTITCDGSVGGINGHAGNNAWTYTTIKNCTVKDNTLDSTDDGGWRVGVVVGTANVGEVTISNITESGNTLTQTGKTAPVGFMRNLYGRAVLGTTGKLTIDGYKYVSEGQFEAENGNVVVNSAEGLNAAMANGGTIVLEAGNYGTIVAQSNVTLIGTEGAKVDCVHLNGANNLTLKKIKFDAANAKVFCHKNGNESGYASIFTATKDNNPNKGAWNLTIEECTFSGDFQHNGVAIAFYDQNRGEGQSRDITIKDCTFNAVNSVYHIYGHYFGGGEMNIVSNTFKTATDGEPIYLGRYQSSVPVKLTDNIFEAVTSQNDAIAIQAHSDSYTVSIDASGNTFAN